MLSISPPAAVAAEEPGHEDTPVLALTHFCRPPFVTFGCVQPGSARSAVLLLENPSPEPARLTVHKLPRHRGFSVPHTDITVPPYEQVPLPITWTPLEEGAVRELVTFVLNDVVKHQAVLLGSAELPAKKRRTRWNTRRKKISPVRPKFLKSKELCSTVTKTKAFNQEQKNGPVITRRARSPLQSCENISKPLVSPTKKEARRSTENRLPTLHVSPAANDLQDFTSTSLRRSKTYSVLCTAEYETIQEVTTTSIQRNVVEEQWTLENGPYKLSISPINSMHSLQHNYTCTPSVLNDFKTLSPTEFCNLNLNVRHDYHTTIQQSSSFHDSLQESLTNISSHTQTPKSVLVTPQRRILSPDSFVNDSYISHESINASHHTPILSPDQFVKENFVASHSLVKDELTTVQFESRCDKANSLGNSGSLEPVDSRLTYCVKKKKTGVMLYTGSSSVAQNAEKMPIASATITKVKASDCNEKPDRPQMKSRRRLKNIEMGAKIDSQGVGFKNLPVINVSDLPVINISSPELPKVERARSICGHKRKSGEISVSYVGSSSESLNNVTQTKKSLQSKYTISRARDQTQVKSKCAIASSAQNGLKIHKEKPETIKEKPVLKISQKTGVPQLGSAVTFKKSKRIVAVPQSKLTFIKTPKTAIPRHPMPFAAKNMFYDERWMAKQERGFTWWLNFILTPDDFAVKTQSMKVNAAALILGDENNHKASVPKAPTKEEVSLKAYTARCRLNKLRRSACCLFTSEPVVKAIRRLEVEIEARRLLVRKDRHLWKDIGERQKILNWLLSYNPLWLRIGLETVFGELIPLESNGDITGLALFILNRLLWNPDIAAEYRHASVPHLYHEGHEEALSKFTLKKMLLLVFFLDFAKHSRLIDHDPCLFCKDAEFKTSRDLLLAFSRDFLSGEGDLSRHLGYLGLPVSHVQTPLDEFDFAVTNLAVDLHCGVRLVRTMELLMQNWSLSKKLRVPAISRLQKMHNVEVALHVLAERGVKIQDERGVSVTSKDIVDRHRERTLALLWNIVFSFQVEVLLNIDHLKEEIKFLKRSYSTQKKLAALRTLSFPTVAKRRESDPFSPENYSERILLVMEWVNSVCAFYNTKVENFTVPFSDGRVFCYLINHYHPSYVPLQSIRQRTTQTIECDEVGKVGLNSSSDSENSLDIWPGTYDHGVTSSALYKELLENESTNFGLLQTAISNLGGIPAMIHLSDTSNTIPDEKIVITFLSFLCARLLDIRKEARAARVIQAAWRRYKVATEEHLLQKKHKAASVIQTAVRKFLSRQWFTKRTTSALVIQKHWRRYMAYKEIMAIKLQKQKLMEASAAVVIQRYWRGYTARKYYVNLRCKVVILQARIRTKIAVSSYKLTLHAARTLQMHIRAWLLGKKHRKNFTQLKVAAVIIQSAFRKWRFLKLKQEVAATLVLQKAYRKWKRWRLEAQTKAAIVIQRMYRMFRERQKYLSVRSAAVKIQSLVKMRKERIYYLLLREKVLFVQTLFQSNMLMCRQRKSYLELRSACVKIQSAVKGHIVRKEIKRWQKAATTLQAYYRMQVERRKYLALYKAAVILQKRFHTSKDGYHYRHLFLLKKRSAICLQAAYRGSVVRKRLKIQHAAAVCIQTAYRCYVAKKEYARIRQSTLKIQRWYRGRKQLKKAFEQFWVTKRAVTTIQSTYRGWIVRKQRHKENLAALTIQTFFRKYHAQKRFKQMRNATLILQHYFRAVLIGRKDRQKYLHICMCIKKVQAVWRGKKVRWQIQTMHKMATCIQSFYRMYICRTNYKAMKQAALCIQRRYRAYAVGKSLQEYYMKARKAVTVLQAAFRGWQIRQELAHLHKAATTIQAFYRSYRLAKRYRKIKMSTILIQRRYHAIVAGRNQRECYVYFRSCVIKLQALYRGLRTRQSITKMKKSAVLLQSVFRMYRQRSKYHKIKQASITIQKHYRASLEGKKQRQQILVLRKAACTLQAAWRGRKVREQINKLHAAATVIQALFRMYKEQRSYKNVRSAAVRLQQRYRAVQDRKKQMQAYSDTRKAILRIQSTFRAVRLQREFREKRRAAVVIQKAFRATLARNRFLALQKAAVCFQRRFKAMKLAERERNDFIRIRNAVVVLQAAFRGFHERRKLEHMHLSATVIQATFRMHKDHVAYQRLKQSTIAIQRYYRAYKLSVHERKMFLNLKQSTLRIQASYRGMKVRKNISKMNKAASRIQATFRMHQCRRRYEKIQWAACLIQEKYRANKLRDFEALRYSFIKDAALVIQASYRGWHVRKNVRKTFDAALVIQKHFKAYRCRRRYLLLKSSTILIQTHYRATVLMHQFYSQYQSLRKAVISIQASYRGFKVRKELALKHAMATRIQSVFRMHKELMLYKSKQAAVRKIQSWYRSKVRYRGAHAQFMNLRKAVITIQAAYRGMKARQNLKLMITSATIIQTNYRMYINRKYYNSLLTATRTTQQRYRAKKETERELCWYRFTKKSSIVLQAAFRGMQVRRQIRNMHFAATVIQRFFKGYLHRKAYLKLRSAALCIQRRYRASILARSHHLDFITRYRSAIYIQYFYRKYKMRQKCRAATKIQCMFRMYRAKTTYRVQRTSAIVIQRYYRNWRDVLHERKYSLKLQNAALVTQASYRGKMCRRNVRKMHDAATLIQAFYRMYKKRRDYKDLLQATKTLQQHFRANCLRNEATRHYRNLRKAAVCIQQAFRAKKLRKETEQYKAALVLQAAWRMYQERKNFIKAKCAAVTLQAAYRGYRIRKKRAIMEHSAFQIQSWFRRCCHTRLQRDQYLSIRTSAIVLQRAFRDFLARQLVKRERAARILQTCYRRVRCRKQFTQLRDSTIILQSYCRMHIARQLYRKQRTSALIIQQWYRSVIAMRRQRAAYLNILRHVIYVQAAVRRFIVQRSFRKMQLSALAIQVAQQNTERRIQLFTSAAHHNLCAIKIQRWFRAHLTLMRAHTHINQVIYIQRWYRLRLQRRNFLRMRRSVTTLQRMVRTWLLRRTEAAITIQRHVRVFLRCKQQEKVTKGIVKFQALWRGYQCRKTNDSKVLQKMRKRLRTVNEETKDENTLGNRTSVALNYLLTYKHFSYILAALRHLEVATRLSSVCCENMAESGAVKVIYTLIRSCNRSIPCMEVIRLSIQILLNLAKYEKTVLAVYEVDGSVEVLLDLMQIYREKPGDKVPEKGGSIFTKTCCLLAIFSLNPQRAQEISAIPKAMDRIRSIYKLISRKHKMDTARSISKQLMESSRISRTISVEVTPVRTRIVSRIKPDWVLRKDNMREIVDPLQAILMVMSTFGLPI
ncbi:abnormal spindle-like microcephaly-associated protein [Gastrophryne carolinensis]